MKKFLALTLAALMTASLPAGAVFADEIDPVENTVLESSETNDEIETDIDVTETDIDENEPEGGY